MIRTFTFLSMILATTPAMAQDEPLHMVQSGTSQGAVTLEKFDAAIEDGAAPLVKAGAEGERFTHHDIASPVDANELREMHGYALLLVSAWSRDAAELPLRAVYLSNQTGQKLPLTLLGSIARVVPASSVAGKVYGANRRDSFYLLPLDTISAGLVLLADFAKNREGFLIDGAPPTARGYGAVVKSGIVPPRAVVQRMMDREYPGFGIVMDAQFQ